MSDKDTKMRELKKQNGQLKSNIQFLEDEIKSLHAKMDAGLRERNDLRSEMARYLANNNNNNNLANAMTPQSHSHSSTSSSMSSTAPTTATTSTSAAAAPPPQSSYFHHHNQGIPLSHMSRPISIDRFTDNRAFRHPVGAPVNPNYWNDLNTSSSSWDVNYNTGLISFKQHQQPFNLYQQQQQQQQQHNLQRNNTMSTNTLNISQKSFRTELNGSKILSFH